MRAASRAFLATASLALGGCPDRTISAVPSAQGHVEVMSFPANPRRDLDLLFLIDNSGSMKQEQDSLKANFARFMTTLESVQGGLPNVHIGVATSDLGTQTLDGTNAGAAFGCTAVGDNGVLRPLVNGQRYISDIADASGNRTRNYTGALEDAFAEIADVGIRGCGIEQHLGSVAKALDPSTAENAGFLRDSAFLAIVVIADEDDCSLAHAGLFAASSNGDEVNFRCTEDGVACDSPATDFLSATGPRSDCHPNAGARFTNAPTKYADQIKRLKADPGDIIVAGILGPTDKFGITKTATGTTVLQPSCTYGAGSGSDQQTAFPAVRTAAFLEEFPGRFTQQRICDPDLSPALIAISQLIADRVGTRCFQAPLVNFASDPATDPPLYSCSVVETKEVANQDPQELAVLGQCGTPTEGTGPCWKIVADPDACATYGVGGLALDIDWKGAAHDDTIHIEANCITQSADDGSGGSGTQF